VRSREENRPKRGEGERKDRWRERMAFNVGGSENLMGEREWGVGSVMFICVRVHVASNLDVVSPDFPTLF
jgi:hypothetical protein